MNRLMLSACLLLAFAGTPVIVGCDETHEHSKTTDVKDDGTVVKKESKTTENTDGTVTKTEKKDVDKPSH
ncbi:MAG TPA: hypothetical protein VER17_10780 [Tepidisphaeraceae bacterium]|nr:hypothetical protein [Tepidisphaeraceae bacterium]